MNVLLEASRCKCQESLSPAEEYDLVEDAAFAVGELIVIHCMPQERVNKDVQVRAGIQQELQLWQVQGIICNAQLLSGALFIFC